MDMKKIIYLLLFFIPVLSEAQTRATGKISGQVTTEQGPAEFVTVRLLKAADSSFVKGIASDLDGRFELQVEADGEYLLSVASVGYKTLHSGILKAGPGFPPVSASGLILIADNKMLKEVAVVAAVPFVETSADKTVLNVENSVVSAGASALEILQKAPGVSIDRDDRVSLKGRSGVVVMVDGKPTTLSTGDLGGMLRAMNASTISKVEIITNPSAKYDAAGNSGIINIKTRKTANAGFNGSINAGAGYAKHTLYNGGINVNYQKGRMNIYGNYNHGRSDPFLSIDVNRSVVSGGQTTLFSQFGETSGTSDNNTWKSGVDLKVAEKHSLGFMMNGFINTGTGSGLNNTSMLAPDRRLDSSLVVSSGSDRENRNTAYNLNYHGFLAEKHELNVDVDYSRFRKSDEGFLDNHYFTPAGTALKPQKLNRTFAPTDIDIAAAKADYTYTITESFKLEAGVKVSAVTTDNDYRFEVLQGGTWVSDPGKTNYFKYDEKIGAGYLNASGSFGSWTMQAGLRAESTRSEGRSVTSNQVVDTTYTRLFPSLSLSRNLSGDHRLGLAFNQRVDRPGYQDLNPFLFLLDEYTYNQGNPYLRPQYSTTLELNYGHSSLIAASAGYSRTKDVIVTLTEQDDLTKTTKAIRRNMDHQTNYYASLSSTLPLTKWWSATGNVNGFYLRYEDAELDAGKIAMQASSTQNFSLPQGFRLELSGRYQSPLTYGIFQVKEQYQLDAGLQKSLFNKRGSLKLNVSDLLNSQKTALTTTFRNMDLRINERYNTRQARLTFSYRFGSSESRSGNRKSGVEEETRRIATGN